MDIAILGVAFKLYRRIFNLTKSYESKMFGSGEMGNWYIGTSSANVPNGWNSVILAEGATYEFPLNWTLHFKNLIIDEDVTITSSLPYLMFSVKEKLIVRGTIQMNEKGENYNNFASFFPAPTVGSSIDPYTLANLRIYLGNKVLNNSYDLLANGGNANSVALSAGGTVGGGGGLVVIYHKKDKFTNSSNQTPYNQGIHANGGKTGNKGGGMIIIAAKETVVEETGVISADGGDGLGCISLLDQVPTRYDVGGAANISNAWGGGGAAITIPLEAM